jgi:hypothetical protein
MHLWTGIKNILRGLALSVMATFIGIALFFTIPDWVAATFFQRPMPYWFYQNEVRNLATQPVQILNDR